MDKKNIEELLSNYMVVPEIQREYVWGSNKNIVNQFIDSIKDNKFLTVNVTINKDGLEDTFKYEAQALRNQYNSIYLPTYNITNLKGREKFYKLYGDSDFYYNEIVKITYGKKDLYVDEKLLNLENKKDEMEASL